MMKETKPLKAKEATETIDDKKFVEWALVVLPRWDEWLDLNNPEGCPAESLVEDFYPEGTPIPVNGSEAHIAMIAEVKEKFKSIGVDIDRMQATEVGRQILHDLGYFHYLLSMLSALVPVPGDDLRLVNGELNVPQERLRRLFLLECNSKRGSPWRFDGKFFRWPSGEISLYDPLERISTPEEREPQPWQPEPLARPTTPTITHAPPTAPVARRKRARFGKVELDINFEGLPMYPPNPEFAFGPNGASEVLIPILQDRGGSICGHLIRKCGWPRETVYRVRRELIAAGKLNASGYPTPHRETGDK